jgi:hypothetical protein
VTQLPSTSVGRLLYPQPEDAPSSCALPCRSTASVNAHRLVYTAHSSYACSQMAEPALSAPCPVRVIQCYALVAHCGDILRLRSLQSWCLATDMGGGGGGCKKINTKIPASRINNSCVWIRATAIQVRNNASLSTAKIFLCVGAASRSAVSVQQVGYLDNWRNFIRVH